MSDEHADVGGDALPAWLSAAGFAPQAVDQPWESLALDPDALGSLGRVITRVAELLGASDPWGDRTDELPRLTAEQRESFGG